MKRELIERISKALADETRLRIFEAISSSEAMNCGQLVTMRGVTAATVSHHLKILHEAGLIRCWKERQFVYSEAKPERLNEYAEAVAAMSRKASKKLRSKSSRAKAHVTE